MTSAGVSINSQVWPVAGRELSGCSENLSVETIHFNRDIQSSISEIYFQCHEPGSNARQEGLRLYRRKAAVEKGSLKPGNAVLSNLFVCIDETNEELLMPPIPTDKKLSLKDKDLFYTTVDRTRCEIRTPSG